MSNALIEKAKQPLDMVKLFVNRPNVEKVELQYAAYSVFMSTEFALRCLIAMDDIKPKENLSIRALLLIIDDKCTKKLSAELSRELMLLSPAISNWDSWKVLIRWYVPPYEELIQSISLAERVIQEVEQLTTTNTTNEFGKR